MGPKLAVVTTQPPRNAPPARAESGQSDAPAPDSFGTVLEEQAAPANSASGQGGSAAPDAASSLKPGGKADVAPDPEVATPTTLPTAEADWQALLARLMSGEPNKIELPPQAEGRRATNAPATAVDPAAPDMLAGLLAGELAPAAEGATEATVMAPDAPQAASPAAEAALAALLAAPAQPAPGPSRKETSQSKPETSRGEGALAARTGQTLAAQTTGVVLPDDGAALPAPAPALDAAGEEGGKPLDGFSRQMLERAADGEPIDEARSVAVRNVTTTTHYPVVNEPMRQIAGQVIREVQQASAPAAATPHKPAVQDVSKTMSIQLEPEALGTVNVKMKLSGGSLTIHIEVAKAETLDMITRSQDVLQRSLQGENCQLDGLTIRAASAADAGGLSQNGAGGQQNSGQANSNGASNGASNQSSAQQQDASSQAGDRSRGQRGQERPSGKSEYDETVTPRDRAAGATGIYL